MNDQPTSKSLTKALIERAGGPAAIGRMFDPAISSQAVSQWEVVPPERCPVIEAGSGIRCEEMRPDLTWQRDKKGRVTGYVVKIKEAA